MYHHTVDGTNPSPVDMVNIHIYDIFQGFYTSQQWLALGFLKHQQYWIYSILLLQYIKPIGFFYLQNHSTNQLPRHGPRGDLPSGTFGVQDILRTGKVAESSISDEAGTFHRRWLSSCKTWENAWILHFFKRLRNYKKKVVFLDFPLFIEELVPSRSLTVCPEKLSKPNRKGSSSNYYFSGANC